MSDVLICRNKWKQMRFDWQLQVILIRSQLNKYFSSSDWFNALVSNRCIFAAIGQQSFLMVRKGFYLLPTVIWPSEIIEKDWIQSVSFKKHNEQSIALVVILSDRHVDLSPALLHSVQLSHSDYQNECSYVLWSFNYWTKTTCQYQPLYSNVSSHYSWNNRLYRLNV